MIKLTSFPVSECDKASEFMRENPPRSTEKQSGIIFHDGYVVIITDDGIANPNDELNVYKSQLEGERHKLMIVKIDQEARTIARDEMIKRLEEIAPEGYHPDLEIKELRKILNKTEKTPNEITNIINEITAVQGNLTNQENSILMNTHEMKRLDVQIKALESLIAKQ